MVLTIEGRFPSDLPHVSVKNLDMKQTLRIATIGPWRFLNNGDLSNGAFFFMDSNNSAES